MKLEIDIPQTKEEAQNEIDEQIKEFQRIGLLPIINDERSKDAKESN